MRISAHKGTARVGFGRERKDENRFFSFPWRRRKTIARREEEWTEVALLLAFGVLVCRACVFHHSSERGTEKGTRAAGTELENEMHQQRERESATAVFFWGGGVNWGLRRRKISTKNVDRLLELAVPFTHAFGITSDTNETQASSSPDPPSRLHLSLVSNSK
jgi:hypothetical protein